MPGTAVHRRHLLLAATGFALAATATRTAAQPSPEGPAVLSLTGRIGLRNTPQGFDFDMAALAALPQHALRTRTPWHPGAPTFTGPLLRTVLAHVQAQGRTLLASALNDYRVEIPATDAQDWDVIIARLQDGRPMRVRERGPLFVIYPFDQDRALLDQRYINRSVWQLRRLDVVA